VNTRRVSPETHAVCLEEFARTDERMPACIHSVCNFHSVTLRMHALWPEVFERSSPLEGRNSRQPRILVSDDQEDILTALTLLLKLNGFRTKTVHSPDDAVDAAKADAYDLILMDLNYSRDTTSGREGLDLLRALRMTGHSGPIVVMTAWGNVALAVEAMRLGASDFVQKPWDNHRLLETVTTQLNRAAEERRRNQRAHSELDIARHVQQKLFPQKLKPFQTVEYAATCSPARHVGGDYYDFFDAGEGRLAGLLADVSGKGVAAAMLMANLQASFRSHFDGAWPEATELLCTINRLFYASTPPEQYATLFYFEYDDERRVLQYVNCGHPAPALLRSSGVCDRLPATGTVIGLFPNCIFEARDVELDADDLLVMFTDGATEFLDESGEEYGEEQLIALAASARRLGAQAALRHIASRLDALNGCGGEPTDDRTVVLLRGR
jgi:sigma-B regulation protein RsbU (phosphoserine phosphatase)